MATLPLEIEEKITAPDRLHMSYEEYLAWADEDVHAEWVDGEVIIQMPPKYRHQETVRFLVVLLDYFVQLFDLGRVSFAPFEMKITPDGASREPDILFIAHEHLDRLTPERLVGPADLLVEIISDDSVKRDRVDKFDEYEMGSVREYWIIDPRPGKQRAWFYQLSEAGHLERVPVGEDGIYRSREVPGFWLNVNWLWMDELPDSLSALVEIVGREKMLEAVRKAGRP